MTEFKTKLLAEGAEAVPVAALALSRLPPLDEQIEALLPKLAHFDDDELLRIAAQARCLEACAFRLRGACVAELRRRTARLAGGRGNRDTARIGVKARLSDVAVRLGVSVSTLKTDARIHEVFFAGVSGLACEPTLPRDYYVTALGSPDPVAAIQTARARSSDSTYNREQFRRYVLALRSASASTTDEPLLPGMSLPTPTITRVSILPDARPALAALIEREAKTPAEVVAAALVAYHEALTAPKTPRRRSTSKTTRQLAQQSLPLSL